VSGLQGAIPRGRDRVRICTAAASSTAAAAAGTGIAVLDDGCRGGLSLWIIVGVIDAPDQC